MTTEHQRFDSTVVNQAWYDTETKELTVQFERGNRYVYHHVTSQMWSAFKSAGSAGAYAYDVLRKLSYKQLPS